MEMNLSFGVPRYRQFPRQHLPPARHRRHRRALHSRQHSAARRRSSCRAMLADLIMEKRGLMLVVGATGSGKSTTIASMLDHRNANRTGHILTIEDPIEFLFKHKKSIVNQREIGIDTHGLARRAEKRHAPGAGLHPDRRNPRQGNHAGGDRLRADRPPVPGHAARQQQLPRAQPHHQLLPAGKPSSLYSSICRSACKRIISQRLVRQPDGKRACRPCEVLLNTRHIAAN